MKRFMLRFLCAFCASVILMSCLSFGEPFPVSADEPEGKMSSVYGYILNNYIETFGVLSTNADGAVTDSRGEFVNPQGVIYADIMNFDNNDCPYLVIFVASSEYRTASCHIWMYDDSGEKARRLAIIEKKYDDVPDYRMGEFHMAWDDRMKYIVYREEENYETVKEEYYTAIDGGAYMLINNPQNVQSTGISGFNTAYIHSGVDISDYNKALDGFFSKLKDAAADSVSYDDISYRLSASDNDAVVKTLMRAALYSDLDLSAYGSGDEYKAALETTTSGAVFRELNAFYDLGDGMYYAGFETDATKYNYAVLRKSDAAENGYQIVKARTDGIPLSDRELKQMKQKYMQSPLLYEKSKSKLRLDRPKKTDEPEKEEPLPITVQIGDEVITIPSEPVGEKSGRLIEPVFSFDKIIDDRVRIPATCIGGGVSAALLAILWVYIFAEEE